MALPLGTALLLGFIQGLAELFPFSSLGLLVILPHVAHFVVPMQGSRYLPFLVALHLGTALALILYFRHEWARIIGGFFRWIGGRRSAEGSLAWLIIWGTIPAGLVGLVLKHKISALFGRPLIAAAFLFVNGLFLFWGNRNIKRYRRPKPLSQLNGREAFKVGLYEIFALIPGLSRSGLTIVAGIRQGLSSEDAAHFSFLLATPIILAAALVELPKLHHGTHGLLGPALVGGATAFVVAWLSTRFLMRYFQTHRLGTLAWISLALGVAALIAVH